jgi:hypothetical protein
VHVAIPARILADMDRGTEDDRLSVAAGDTEITLRVREEHRSRLLAGEELELHAGNVQITVDATDGPLWKSTITIWSRFDPQQVELDDLAREAVSGEAYCADMTAVYVEHPETDAKWDDTEFFQES